MMRRFSVCFLLIAAVLLLSVCVSAAESSAPDAFALSGTLKKDSSRAKMYLEGPGKGESVYFQPGDRCEVLGRDGKYYIVRWQDRTGYIAAASLVLGAVPAEGVPEQISGSFDVTDKIPFLKETRYLPFTGTLACSEPLTGIAAFLWDERQQQAEAVEVFFLKEPTASVEASEIKKLLRIEKMAGGRKKLVIQGLTAEGSVVLYRTTLAFRGKYQEPAHVTKMCGVSEPALADESLNSAWRPSAKKAKVTISVPAEANAALLTLEWKSIPSAFTVTLTAEDGTETVREMATGFYADAVELTANVREITITCTDPDAKLSTVRVYPEGYPEEYVQRWEPVAGKVDLMVISAHQDDEFVFFAGVLPYYAARGKEIAVLYMADCGRNRYREALDGLWTAGVKTHPLFMGWRDKLVASMSVAVSIWKRNDPEPVCAVVRKLRQYKPDVIVTHDFDGEYGHNQHRLTAQLVAEAVTLAADPSYDPESAEEFGTWQVQKAYFHLYPENRIIMDWEQPLGDDPVVTPMFIAKEGFDRHRSQQGYFTIERFGTEYDCRAYGLYYSAVGPDVAGGDLFENIPAAGNASE